MWEKLYIFLISIIERRIKALKEGVERRQRAIKASKDESRRL